MISPRFGGNSHPFFLFSYSGGTSGAFPPTNDYRHQFRRLLCAESFAIAETAATNYCVRHASSCDEPPGVVTIDTAYVQTNAAILREQLQKAGVRLAHLLGTALHR